MKVFIQKQSEKKEVVEWKNKEKKKKNLWKKRIYVCKRLMHKITVSLLLKEN